MPALDRSQRCGCAPCPAPAASPDAPPSTAPAARRRFGAVVVAASLAPMLTVAAAQTPAAKARAGHRLAIANGDRAGQELSPADLVLGDDPILAYPMEPGGPMLVSRANLMSVMRVPEDSLSAEARPHAPQGIVAFSAVCTHYGCPVTKTDAQHRLVCNCHGSAFEPGRRGVVSQGPATRRLPMLPLTLNGGALVVSAGLDGPIGPPT